MPTVLSLCDYTGLFVQPWLDAGYNAIVVDPQHQQHSVTQQQNGAKLTKIPLTIAEYTATSPDLLDVVLTAAWPPCTDLAVSGARHFAAKAKADPYYLQKAMGVVYDCAALARRAKAPWLVENPVSRIATQWRKPDCYFHPCEYGGYLPVDDVHPLYPAYIPPRDSYNKKTCLWTSKCFTLPPKRPVMANGYSTTYSKLGGRSIKTKNIRSATPRGFAVAMFQHYA